MAEEYVIWEERFNVGIALIDAQHKKLVELTNSLFEGCRQGGEEAEQQFRVSVKAAVDYVKEHFSAEELLMQTHGYPGYAAHKQQHATFVHEILARVQGFAKGQKFVPNQFVRFLREWLLEHIAVTDQQYKEFFHSRGVR